MRILLIQSKSKPKEESPILPLGLCYVATALSRHNHEVNIYDTNTSNDPIRELRESIKIHEPQVIGVGLRNIDTSRYTHHSNYVEPFNELISQLKEMAPGIKILAGGPGFSIYGMEIMKRVPTIDYGIFNEGEETIPELLNSLDQPQDVKGIFYRLNDTVQFTGAREPIDFRNLPAPKRDFLDLTPYLEHSFSIGVQTKRGCPFKCTYCTYPYLQGAELRIRPVHDVLDELEELVKKFSLRSFFFVDSIFNVPQSYTRELLEGMLERGINLRWRSYDEPKFADTEYMRLAKETGHDLFEFSPDGVSRSTLRGLDKVTTEQDIKRVYSIAKRTDDIKVIFSFFINSPGESIGNIFRLFLFVLRCKLFLRKKLDGTHVHLIRIYPNTKLHALALDKGLLRRDDDLIRPVFYNPPPLRYILVILFPIARRIRSVLGVLLRRLPV